MDNFQKDALAQLARDNFYRKWAGKIPRVKFDSKWDVRAIPPWGGALVRYIVRWQGSSVSIYLDGDHSLGLGPEPAYWEIYPGPDGDTYRCAIDETDELVAAIREAFVNMNESPLAAERNVEGQRC